MIKILFCRLSLELLELQSLHVLAFAISSREVGYIVYVMAFKQLRTLSKMIIS